MMRETGAKPYREAKSAGDPRRSARRQEKAALGDETEKSDKVIARDSGARKTRAQSAGTSERGGGAKIVSENFIEKIETKKQRRRRERREENARLWRCERRVKRKRTAQKKPLCQ